MSLTDALTIKQLSSADNHYIYECQGSVSANAMTALNELRQLPDGVQVTLDFEKVERVNSMGLSLLLKIFEEWERVGIQCKVCKLNRMISMLFKITGLGKYMQGHIDTAGSEKVSVPINKSVENPVMAEHSEQADKLNDKKLNFIASLQSGHQLSGWYLFNTFLQRKLHRAIHFEQTQDVNGDVSHLLFAKPFDACARMQNNGFISLARPDGEADEVVILCRNDDGRTLQDFTGNINVVTAQQSSFVYLLGRFLCDESGLDSSGFDFCFSGNEIKALQMLIRKKSDMAFVLKKTYEGLSSHTRKNVRVIDESQTDFAFHHFCIAPELASEQEEISRILLDMEQDEQGKNILSDIQFNGWVKPEEGELQMLQMIYQRYTV